MKNIQVRGARENNLKNLSVDLPRNALIVITGVSRGLGRALVDGMIAADHIVAGCARSSSAIADLQTAYPSPHRFDAVDVVEGGGADLEARRPRAHDAVLDEQILQRAVPV